MSRVPPNPGTQLFPVSAERPELALKGATICQRHSTSNGDCGSRAAGRVVQERECQKPQDQISEKRQQLESRHSLGSGDSQVASREQEASQEHLGVQERDGGAGKKASGLSYVLSAKVDQCPPSLSLLSSLLEFLDKFGLF